MAAMAISECLDVVPHEQRDGVPVLLVVAEDSRPGRLEGLDATLLAEVAELAGTRFHPGSAVLPRGRVGGVEALLRARALLQRGQRLAVVAGVDGFLTALTLRHLESERRLLTSTNTNGLLPGEGAAAVLVRAPEPREGASLRCLGIGLGDEPSDREPDLPLRGEGLVAAIRGAFADGGHGWRDVDYRITDISGEQRAFKRLLRVAGDEGWELAAEALGTGSGEVFAAGVLALERGDAGLLTRVTAALPGAPDAAPGLVSALGWVGWKRARPAVAQLLGSADMPLRRIGVRATAVLRQDPGPGLGQLVRSEDAGVAAAACRAAGELGRLDLLPLLEWQQESDCPEVRLWAAWAATLLGSRRAPEALLAVASNAGRRRCDELVATATRGAEARGMDAQARAAWVARAAAETPRAAVVAAGATLDPTHVPWLLERMGDDEIAPVAGEAFSLITGADLAYEDLERDAPTGFEAGPNDSPEDEDVEMDPDERLPWPDPDLAGRWWRPRAPRMRPGQRHMLGRRPMPEKLAEILREGFQRQRLAAAEELKLLEPGRPLAECRAGSSGTDLPAR